MGQTYYTEILLHEKPLAENALSRVMDDFLKKHERGLRKKYDGRWQDLQLPTFVELIFPNSTSERRPDGWDLYASSFDATYSWEDVIAEAFSAIAPYLEEGSCLDVWPDSGCYRIKVEHGETCVYQRACGE